MVALNLRQVKRQLRTKRAAYCIYRCAKAETQNYTAERQDLNCAIHYVVRDLGPLCCNLII